MFFYINVEMYVCKYWLGSVICSFGWASPYLKMWLGTIGHIFVPTLDSRFEHISNTFRTHFEHIRTHSNTFRTHSNIFSSQHLNRASNTHASDFFSMQSTLSFEAVITSTFLNLIIQKFNLILRSQVVPPAVKQVVTVRRLQSAREVLPLESSRWIRFGRNLQAKCN
jgi:hypothetical protein